MGRSPVSPDMKGWSPCLIRPWSHSMEIRRVAYKIKIRTIIQQPASTVIGKTEFQACTFYTHAHTTRKINFAIALISFVVKT